MKSFLVFVENYILNLNILMLHTCSEEKKERGIPTFTLNLHIDFFFNLQFVFKWDQAFVLLVDKTTIMWWWVFYRSLDSRL